MEASCKPALLAGACGAYCGACLAFRAELADEAQALLQRVRRQGFLALARHLQPADGLKVEHFFEILDRLARTPACPGCAAGGGPQDCPVRACARLRRRATCAGCPELAACARGELSPAPVERKRRRRAALRAEPGAFPFHASAYLARLTRKYRGWNLENLERIRAEGLEAWEQDMERRVIAGFRSVQIKAEDDVYGDD